MPKTVVFEVNNPVIFVQIEVFEVNNAIILFVNVRLFAVALAFTVAFEVLKAGIPAIVLLIAIVF